MILYLRAIETMHKKGENEKEDTASCEQDVDEDVTQGPELISLHCSGLLWPLVVAVACESMLQRGLLIQLTACEKRCFLDESLRGGHLCEIGLFER
jgi:hypothetical protein